MSTDGNLAVVRRFVDDVINRGDPGAIDVLIAGDYLDHAALPGMAGGPERVRRTMARFHDAFPDFRFEIEEMLSAGDKVVLRGTGYGTHQGEFLGILPTGKAINVTQIHIIRLSGGQIVEHWAESDWLCVVYQLGEVPAFLRTAAEV